MKSLSNLLSCFATIVPIALLRASSFNDQGTSLHCCAVPEGRSMQIVCDSIPGDAISEVSFAAYGAPQQGATICGQEQQPACGADVKTIIEEQCLTLRTCTVNTTIMGDPCPLAQDRRILAVRWRCRSDNVHWQSAFAQLQNSLPLQVQGAVIVNASGDRVRLRGVNWAGAHEWRYVPEGLDRAPLRNIARLVRELGFNFVRLTFALETWRLNPRIEDHSVAANPQLRGLRAVEILDWVIDALANEGIMTWLDNHMLDADWCCADRDCNGLWFNARYSADDWVATLADVARRYANTSALVGIGLKNEPRRVCGGRSWFGEGRTCNNDFLNTTLDDKGCAEARWADGPEHLRYRDAVEAAGQAILKQNPRLLVSACGLDYGNDLVDVAAAPPDLPKENLLYEAHEYPWYHPSWLMKDGTSRYACKLDHNWGYLIRDGVAPVLLSEFGMSHTWMNDVDLKSWFDHMVKYVQEDGPLGDKGGLDWAYWQLSGMQVYGTARTEGDIESFGLLNECWTAPADSTHFAALQQLMSASASPSAIASNRSCRYASSQNETQPNTPA